MVLSTPIRAENDASKYGSRRARILGNPRLITPFVNRHTSILATVSYFGVHKATLSHPARESTLQLP